MIHQDKDKSKLIIEAFGEWCEGLDYFCVSSRIAHLAGAFVSLLQDPKNAGADAGLIQVNEQT
jgi:hypothetical protein